jgi:non-specific serine/threonine protein kinase/serine/threonine-protein kinase
MDNLANDLRSEGNYTGAERLDQETYDSRRRTLGGGHPASLTSLEFEAIDLSHERKYSDAEKLFREAVQSAKNANSPDVLALAWYNFACGAAIAGRRSDALQYLSSAVNSGYKNPGAIAADVDLKSLHSDPRFNALLAEDRQAAATPAK